MLKIRIAFAGVGNPIKEEVCRESILNFANLYPEAKVIVNPIKAITGKSNSKAGIFSQRKKTPSVSAEKDLFSNCTITIPGANPLVIKSAKESNCNPNSLGTLKSLAKNPSKKSKKIHIPTKTAAKTK